MFLFILSFLCWAELKRSKEEHENNLGQLMGAIMKELKGNADGAVVKAAVEKSL